MEALATGEVRLMNFRVSDHIRNSFDTACRYNGSNMTSELTRMMRLYVTQEANRAEQNYHENMTLEKAAPRHRTTARKTATIDDWYDGSKKTNPPTQRHGEYLLNPETHTWEIG